jgi:hypothetical protein
MNKQNKTTEPEEAWSGSSSMMLGEGNERSDAGGESVTLFGDSCAWLHGGCGTPEYAAYVGAAFQSEHTVSPVTNQPIGLNGHAFQGSGALLGDHRLGSRCV